MLFNVRVSTNDITIKEYAVEAESKEEIKEMLSELDFGDCDIDIENLDILTKDRFLTRIVGESFYILSEADFINERI